MSDILADPAPGAQHPPGPFENLQPRNRYGVPLYSDGTIKRRAIPERVRREVAIRDGGIPGEVAEARCAYCGAVGKITWPRRRDGKPGAWVHFGGLHLDHVHPYSKGGQSVADNLVLACRSCNSSKCDRSREEWGR